MVKVNRAKFILILLLLPYTVMCGRYDFLLFENFELTKKTFLKEQELVRTLENDRQNLYQLVDELRENTDNISRFEIHANTRTKILQNLEHALYFNFKNLYNFIYYEKRLSLHTRHFNYRDLNQEYNHLYSYENLYKLDDEHIMEGALKGVIMLQATYEQEIIGYSAGLLRFKSDNKYNSRRTDSLNIHDLIAMSRLAFSYFHWYDNGLSYLKFAINMFYSRYNKKRDRLPNTLEKELIMMKKTYATYHNEMFYKKSNSIGPEWKLYPRAVDTETLEITTNDKSKLREFDSLNNAIQVDRQKHEYLPGQLREPLFQNVCNGNIKSNTHSTSSANPMRRAPKCHFVHHFTPLLNLVPFHLEVKLYYPFRTIIHDFFTDEEMYWMLAYSKPRLTASREGSVPHSTSSLTKADLRYKVDKIQGYTVNKAVTATIRDIMYNETQEYVKVRAEGKSLSYKHPPLQDPYSYTIEHATMYDISKKIELVTNFNVTTRHGASGYQTTNYGLSGMVTTHIDPWGYEQGVNLVEDRRELSRTGDYIATFMGWVEETQAGGGTAFTEKGYEGIVEPTKGSAAFWLNLSSCHLKDTRSSHGGCPVLKGSKWIVNKWIYSWDQWKKWQCDLNPYRTIHPFEGMSR